MEIETTLLVGGVVALAYLVRGITGAGSGLIAVPVLVQILPIQTVVPMMLLLDFTASVIVSRASRFIGDWLEVRRLIPAALIGIGIGTILLVRLPQRPLLLALGIAVMVFGVRNLITNAAQRPISTRWAPLAGLLGGAIGAVFGTGGPPYMIYLSRRVHDKSVLRATFSRLFLVEGALRIAAFGIAGLLYRPEVLTLYGACLIALALGLWIGGKIHLSLTNMQVMKIVGGLLTLSGTSLAARAYIMG